MTSLLAVWECPPVSLTASNCEEIEPGKWKVSTVHGLYVGEIRDGQMHGRGKFIWTDRAEWWYEGEFDHNTFHGEGELQCGSQSRYVGSFQKGKRDGSGTMVHGSACYKGGWKDGMRHGQGLLVFDFHKGKDVGGYYDGGWEADEKFGSGEMLYPSGNRYKGEWRHNKPNGQGHMTWTAAGQEYTGSWKEGKQHGEGTYSWSQMVAVGKQTKKLYNVYIGEFREGKKHGHGTCQYADGSQFDGMWDNDEKSGDGRFKRSWGDEADITVFHDLLPTAVADMQQSNGEEESGVNSAAALRTSATIVIDDLFEISSGQAVRDRQGIKALLVRHHNVLRDVFRYYAQLGTSDLSRMNTISQMQFWRFCKDCKINSKDMLMATIDRIYILANHGDDSAEQGSKGGDNYDNPDNALVFSEFVEALIRLGVEKYRKITSSVFACFEKILQLHVLLYAGKEELRKATKKPTDDPEVHAVVKKYRKKLVKVFDRYSALDDSSLEDVAASDTLNVKEFLVLLRDTWIIDSKLSSNDAMRIFKECMLDDADEGGTEESFLDYEMLFPEFLETLSRVAIEKYKDDRTKETNAEKVDYLFDTQILARAKTS